jgi:hypothetical protein
MVNNEFQGIWKEAVVAKFKVLFPYLPAESWENKRKLLIIIIFIIVQIPIEHIPAIILKCYI